MTDDAAYWAEININIINLLVKNNSTMIIIIEFKIKFKKQFLRLIIEIAPVSFNIEMIKLCQLSNKLLLIYYWRVMVLISRIKAKNKSRLFIRTILA